MEENKNATTGEENKNATTGEENKNATTGEDKKSNLTYEQAKLITSVALIAGGAATLFLGYSVGKSVGYGKAYRQARGLLKIVTDLPV